MTISSNLNQVQIFKIRAPWPADLIMGKPPNQHVNKSNTKIMCKLSGELRIFDKVLPHGPVTVDDNGKNKVLSCTCVTESIT